VPKKMGSRKRWRTEFSDIGKGAESVRSGPQWGKKGRGLDARRGRKKSLTLDYTPGCSV